jgi:hypothetical protein
MRLRWRKGDSSDISKVLDSIKNEYGMNLETVNVYFTLSKDGIQYSLYDIVNGKEAQIEVDKNLILSNRLNNYICFSQEDITILYSIMEKIVLWNEDTKKAILNFFIKEFGILSKSTNPDHFDFSEYEFDQVERIAYGLMEMCGLVNTRLLEYQLRSSINIEETD